MPYRPDARLTVPAMRIRPPGNDGAIPVSRPVMCAILLLVVVSDQASKWWGWRHAPIAQINDGGDMIVGRTVSTWYAAPLPGALLDLVAAGLLGFALQALFRSRQPTTVLGSAALALSGWSSNLLDRLGMHYLSAPGSRRGAVDFIPIADNLYNIADFVIAAGTLLFLVTVTVTYLTWPAAKSPPADLRTGLRAPRPARARRLTATLAGSALLVLVIVGAENPAGPTCGNSSGDTAQVAAIHTRTGGPGCTPR